MVLDGAGDGDDAEVGNSNTGDRNGGNNRVHFETSRVIERSYIKALNGPWTGRTTLVAASTRQSLKRLGRERGESE